MSLHPNKIKNTSAVLRAKVRILTTSFSLILQQTTTVVVVTYIIASLIGFRSLMYASCVFCFQPPTLIANLSTFPEKKNKKKWCRNWWKEEKKLFFFSVLFHHTRQIIFKYITSVLYTLVSYLLYIRFANQNLSLSLSLFLSHWLIHDWWSKTRGRIFER